MKSTLAHPIAIAVSLTALSLPLVNANSMTESLLSIVNQSREFASPLTNTDEGTAKRGLAVNQDDITLEQLKTPILLNSAQQHQAIVWGLSEAEEIRYLNLMQNKALVRYGSLHLSPVDILGINARNDSERKHYALMAAQLEIERAARELAWAQTYKEAVREIAQGKLRILPFDMTPYDPYHYTPIAWQPQDKLIVLLSVDTPFKGTIDTIIDNMEREKTLTLDLFFIDNSVSRETLNAWAASHNIPKLLINQKRITLNNNDNNQYESLKKYREKDSKLPIILLKRNGQIQTVSTSLF